MKIRVLSCIVASILSSSIYATDLAVNQNGVDISTTEEALASDGLKFSKTLLASTIQLAQIATKNNELSQSSMLQLSQDIGTMADRINVMADKIVATQNIQSLNLEMTEKNMLLAQKNLLGALQNIDTPQIEKNIQKAKTTLDGALAKERVNIDIAKSKNTDEIISKMQKAAPQYRYKYMNALKVNTYSLDMKDREKALQSVLEKIGNTKENAQKDIDTSSIDGMDSSSIGGVGDVGGMGGSDAGNSGGGMF